jgi:hypothetical protein
MAMEGAGSYDALLGGAMEGAGALRLNKMVMDGADLYDVLLVGAMEGAASLLCARTLIVKLAHHLPRASQTETEGADSHVLETQLMTLPRRPRSPSPRPSHHHHLRRFTLVTRRAWFAKPHANRAKLVKIRKKVNAKSAGSAGTGMTSLKTTTRCPMRIVMLWTRITTGMMMRSGALPMTGHSLPTSQWIAELVGMAQHRLERHRLERYFSFDHSCVSCSDFSHFFVYVLGITCLALHLARSVVS